MVPIIATVLLLCCLRGFEPKIVYSRQPRNDTTMATTTPRTTTVAMADDDDDEPTTTSTAAAATMVAGGRRYADNKKSMSLKTDVYGVQFYAPPLIHRDLLPTTIGGHHHQQLQPHHHHHHQQQHHHHQHQQQPQPPQQQQQHQQRGHQPTPAYYHRWEPATATAVQDGQPILMNPLMAYGDDPSTVRYPVKHRHHQQRPMTRLIKYTADPSTAALQGVTTAFQMPAFLTAAEPVDDERLLDSLPALQYALMHQAAAAVPQQYAALQPHVVKPTAVHHAHHRPLPPPPHRLHHLHHHHQHGGRYAYGPPPPGGQRYTQVPFVYNLPAPPPRRGLGPAEYDIVTRFNRLLKQRERDDRNDARPRPEDAVAAVGGSDEEEAADEETTTRPAPKAAKKKKKNKKQQQPRKKQTTPAPVVEEEREDEDADRQPPQLSPQQQDDDRQAADEEPTSEEQESQNVATAEKLPEGTIVHETEAELQNLDEQSELNEHFGDDLNFDDSNGERVEFQLHGLGGPESYKFGFDTGKGTNRQFRYEERDNSGNVHGHYGYLDNDGKMQVYNYSSHPESGYHAQKSESLEA